MSVKWYSWKAIPYLLATLFWFYMLWRLQSSAPLASPAKSALPLLTYLLLGIGLALSYRTLAGFINKTYIEIGEGKISIRYGPLPWLRKRHSSVHSIRQIFCDIIMSQGGTEYKIMVVVDNDQMQELPLWGLNRDQKFFVEELVAAKLGIERLPTVNKVF